jgi:glutamate dehydrogenase
MTLQGAASGVLIDSILDWLSSHVPSEQLSDAQTFTGLYLSRVPEDELASRDAAQWGELALAALEFARERNRGVAKIRVIAPAGGVYRRTVVEVVTDDMPFLVDSVGIAIAGAGLDIHWVIHPVMRIARDASGCLTALDVAADAHGAAEALIHFEVDRVVDPAVLDRLEQAIASALDDVRASVADWPAMRQRMLDLADDLGRRKTSIDAASVSEAQDFLSWVTDDNFTYLGYRKYRVVESDGDEVLQAVEDSGLGILRAAERSLALRSLRTLAAHYLPRSGSVDAIILTKTNARAQVHRPGYMDYIGVLEFDAAGMPLTEQRFLGLYTSSAYTARPQDVPLLRRKVDAVMRRSGLRRDSHSGKELRHVLGILPRDELFQCSEDELYAVAAGILALRERPRTRLFLRRDPFGRFYSCLVCLPRDRFGNDVSERIQALLKHALRGERVDSSSQVGESPLAYLHLVIRPKPGDRVEYDAADLEAKVAAVVRSWHDKVRDTLVHQLGEVQGLALAGYARTLPAGYMEDVPPEMAAADVCALAALKADNDIHLALYQRDGGLRFKVMHYGKPTPLSEALPMLENLGVRVLAEHVYTLDWQGRALTIHDFELTPQAPLAFPLADLSERFQSGFEALWRGRAENDGFNKLVLRVCLHWRQVSVLRAYCKYLLQIGVAFSQAYMEETLNRYPAIAGLLVELFEAGFDPQRESTDVATIDAARGRLGNELRALLPAAVLQTHPDFIDELLTVRSASRTRQIEAGIAAIRTLLGSVASLDEDRILRAYLSTILATLRTSFFQRCDGKPKDYLSFKLDPARVPDMPKPRPYREIFVYSPRVEGVHLRFGPVARGGLRWSDRREDFRTEVLGLVKAQMVKNTVIVPVGSKGGFFVKRPPDSGDRDAVLAEGIACYTLFIQGLLDITDNLIDDTIVHPQDVVRYDGDDPYLVVAADKGTATFSDIANGVSAEHGFWLGDAFASGGSAGYDHKGMGITARGAWESVKRHFRALGRDTQNADFTCAGIGDMSGDVFGNGMLMSWHIRLVAAFDHRHVFIDPNPDPALSFAERERLFKLPRSSWADYDAKLISAGGGVYPRAAKSIALTSQAREALGIATDVEAMSPTELVKAILKAPLDLLWNGGIGTYVKAETESNADVGDRANNALRIDGRELRCKVVGEGGNLGFTQKGRIEAARHGVLLNTDFIDNSAGVDTSDHEVNIKILLNDAVRRGELTVDARNTQLAAMTAEVGRLVLTDNYRQNQAISVMEHMSAQRLGSNAHFVHTLESEGLLDRQLESLPTATELAERKVRHQGLTRPELAVLLSYAKIKLYQQLLDSDVPEDAYLSKELVRYFPEPLREKYAEHMQRHRLKREIIATAVTNSMVNRMDATFVLRMQEDTGQSPAAIAKAYSAAREITDARALWARIDALDGVVAEAVQIDTLLMIWDWLRHLTRWLLNHRGAALDIADIVARYAPGAAQLRAALPRALAMAGQAKYAADTAKWRKRGISLELAGHFAAIAELNPAFDIVEMALEGGHRVERVASVFFALGEALNIDGLRRQIENLPVESNWHVQARGALRDELASQHYALASQVLVGTADTIEHPVAQWLDRNDSALKFALAQFSEIREQTVDYPMASVALRRLAKLVQAGAKAVPN